MHFVELITVPESKTESKDDSSCPTSLFLPIITGQSGLTLSAPQTKLIYLLSTCLSPDIAKICIVLHTSANPDFYDDALEVSEYAYFYVSVKLNQLGILSMNVQ